VVDAAPVPGDQCGATIGPGQVITEQSRPPIGDRDSIGACPLCAGPVPDPQSSQFHTIVAAARDQATPEQTSSLAAALRHHLNAPIAHGSADDLTAEWTGPWQPIAHEMHHTPTDQWNQRLALLLLILDTPNAVGGPPSPQAPQAR